MSQNTLYPSTSCNILYISLYVSPLLCVLKDLTFSRTIAFGFFPFFILSSTISAILKNNVPLASSNPFCCPIILNGWHGKPPISISQSGISSNGISFISPRTICSPKLALYVCTAYLSKSFAHIIS